MVLSITGSVLNLVAMSDRPDRQDGLSWRQSVVAEIRRHPRLHAAELACFGIALAFLIYSSP
jgi:hypothetical protein